MEKGKSEQGNEYIAKSTVHLVVHKFNSFAYSYEIISPCLVEQ